MPQYNLPLIYTSDGWSNQQHLEKSTICPLQNDKKGLAKSENHGKNLSNSESNK